MKLLTAAAATSLATLLPAVTADFVLYAQDIGGNGIIEGAQGWQAYPDVADCDSVRDWIWRTSDDVSGGKYGVRCKGSCKYGNEAPDMEEVEMNFNNDDLHFSTALPCFAPSLFR
jgi:hypothetical protein